MWFVYAPKEFLGELNSALLVKAPDVIEQRKVSGEKCPELFPSDTLDFNFNFNVDLVISGPCSSSEWGNSETPDEQFPMGKIPGSKGKPDKSWLHAILKEQKPKPKSILVYPCCCGCYGREFKQRLVHLFPKITWHFPNVRDLTEMHHAYDWLAKDLLRAGALKIVPATEK
jgi:hypothetical protein